MNSLQLLHFMEHLYQLLSKLFDGRSIAQSFVGMLVTHVRVPARFSFKFMRDVFCNLHSKKQLAIFTLSFLIIRSDVQFYLNATSHLCGFLHPSSIFLSNGPFQAFFASTYHILLHIITIQNLIWAGFKNKLKPEVYMNLQQVNVTLKFANPTLEQLVCIHFTNIFGGKKTHIKICEHTNPIHLEDSLSYPCEIVSMFTLFCTGLISCHSNKAREREKSLPFRPVEVKRPSWNAMGFFAFSVSISYTCNLQFLRSKNHTNN